MHSVSISCFITMHMQGLVADRNLSLCDLIGVITAFFHRLGIPLTHVFSRMSYHRFKRVPLCLWTSYTIRITLTGITELKFKPAYNPYTEPSMEIFGFSPELKRWIEIGNSGMFRVWIINMSISKWCQQTYLYCVFNCMYVVVAIARDVASYGFTCWCSSDCMGSISRYKPT